MALVCDNVMALVCDNVMALVCNKFYNYLMFRGKNGFEGSHVQIFGLKRLKANSLGYRQH